MKLTYKKDGDYFVPNVIIHLPRRLLGIWGLWRKWYLQDNCPILYSQLVLEEKLYEYCLEIEDAALSRMEQLLHQP